MVSRKELEKLIAEICPSADLSSNSLVDDEVIDSFDLVAIISELVSSFDIEIGVEDITPENFNSIEAIQRLIEGKE